MKSFPETGNFGPSFDSVSQIPGLVPSSSSLLQQMSASLQTSGQAMAANSGAKFPELSITKHESRLESQDQGQSAGGYKEADIQDQLNMLRTMPDFMRMQTTNIQEEEASGEEMEDEENNIGHKVGGEEHLTHSDFIFLFQGTEIYSDTDHRGEPGAARGAVHGGLHVGHVDTSITTP